MARVIIEGLTMKQARVFASWYEGQGEQDADVWFEENRTPTPMTDCGRDGGYKEVDEKNQIVTIFCRTASQ